MSLSLSQRRFPDFSYITDSGRTLTEHLDCVIIRCVCVCVCVRVCVVQVVIIPRHHSHFHLDHCGALPYLSEMCGYAGPIYMTHPTKAICPILLVSPLLSGSCRDCRVYVCGTGGLQEDHSGEKGRAELLHISNDQGLHEKSSHSQPSSESEGTT